MINRWYRERGSIDFDKINGAAEFLLLSALHENTFPIHYWASLMDADRLRDLLLDLIAADPYPERHNVPYVVGAFLWQERTALLAPHAAKKGSYAGYGRVVRAADRAAFLLTGRTPPENFELPSGKTVRLSTDVLTDAPVAAAVFDVCLSSGHDYIRGHRGQLHQLDLWLHGRRD